MNFYKQSSYDGTKERSDHKIRNLNRGLSSEGTAAVQVEDIHDVD